MVIKKYLTSCSPKKEKKKKDNHITKYRWYKFNVMVWVTISPSHDHCPMLLHTKKSFFFFKQTLVQINTCIYKFFLYIKIQIDIAHSISSWRWLLLFLWHWPNKKKKMDFKQKQKMEKVKYECSYCLRTSLFYLLCVVCKYRYAHTIIKNFYLKREKKRNKLRWHQNSHQQQHLKIYPIHQMILGGMNTQKNISAYIFLRWLQAREWNGPEIKC